MSSNFNVNAYWLERGRHYMEETRTPAEFHRLQERYLLDLLRGSALPMRQILEIGCGFGRVTKLLAQTWPDAEITAVDLSPDQLANARRYCGENPRLHFEQYDFYSGQPLPGTNFDTVIAIEVFLHHPPEVVIALMKKLAAVGRFLVSIDWSEQWSWPTPEHVWVHDYAKLYSEAGLRCATFPLPEKVDGKQQKLFIAARELPPIVLTLEEQIRSIITAAPAANPDWAQQLQLATSELQNLIAPGATFILVDDGQWGRVRSLESYRVIPFLERDGQYWGPPPDDATAWQELKRLQHAGATHIAFAWPAFWWLQHYAEFNKQLRTEFPCVLENERLTVFGLPK
jgi:SAM-dependent methyltransferase